MNLPPHGRFFAKTLYCRLFFENTGRRGLGQFKQSSLNHVIPAWTAGIPVYMDVSGRILASRWMPAIHAGVTVISISCFVGERKIMNHFVATGTSAQNIRCKSDWFAKGLEGIDKKLADVLVE